MSSKNQYKDYIKTLNRIIEKLKAENFKLKIEIRGLKQYILELEGKITIKKKRWQFWK